MKTNEYHVLQAKRMFTEQPHDHLDTRIQVLRLISYTEGKGPLTLGEIEAEFDGIARLVAVELLKSELSNGLIERVELNGSFVYKHTKYFEDLVFWQKVKAGLIERPAK